MLRIGILVLTSFLVTGSLCGKPPPGGPGPIRLIVMDPLAKELACLCVKGYGQRDYRRIAALLQKGLKQPVALEFSDDLSETVAELGLGLDAVIIGKQSSITAGAKKARLKCHPVCALTDRDGGTMLTGLFLARSSDPAKELKDIGGREVFIGVAESDQLHAAVLAALHTAGVGLPKVKSRGSCTDAALDLLDSPLSPPPIAVIASYALPLLEGCGSVKPGELRVIGKTQPVPFITVFMTDSMPAAKQEQILKLLLGVKGKAKLLRAMESRDGFVPLKAQAPVGVGAGAALDWPDWRGAKRDGHVPRLPTRLPATAKIVWRKGAMEGGLAGLSISGKHLILAERDFAEEHDVYRCLNVENGELLWQVGFPARGKLDFGQSPRATPVIHQEKAYLLGAFGGLRCVDLSDGKVVWERQLPEEFKAPLPTWGMCSTPLLIDDLLIVNPGGTNASLVALERATGRTRWTTPGLPAAYSAFICGEFGGCRQLVGYDQQSLGGWDAKTGRRLWQLVPPAEGDFNVPTPVAVDGGVLVCTENNGTRFYQFDDSGRIVPKPASQFAGLAPTTVSPVVTCGRVFGAIPGLQCLDLRQGLKPLWHREEKDLGDHATLIADDERVLVITLAGELILLDAKADRCVILSRLRLFSDDVEVYSHPALVGNRLYARAGSSIVCVDLEED